MKDTDTICETAESLYTQLVGPYNEEDYNIDLADRCFRCAEIFHEKRAEYIREHDNDIE